MNPDEVVQAVARPVRAEVEVEVVRAQEHVVPEIPKTYWEEQNFLPDIARVCSDLESEREKFLFNAELRQLIETVINAKSVEDFDRYTVDELFSFATNIRHQVPQVEREVLNFINQISRARVVSIDNIDFI